MTKNNDDLEWGKKMVKLSVQFWTNDLPRGSDKKTAWESGAIHVIANKGRGLKHNHIFFRDLREFMPKMAELLNKNGRTQSYQYSKNRPVFHRSISQHKGKNSPPAHL